MIGMKAARRGQARPLWACPRCGTRLVTDPAQLDRQVQSWLRQSDRLMGMRERLR